MGAVKRKRKAKGRARRQRVKPVAVTLAAERVGNKLRVSAWHDGRMLHLDTIDFDLAPQRERFIKGICKRVPGVSATAVEADLMKVAATLPPLPEAKPANEGNAEVIPPLVKVVMSYLPDGSVTAERDGVTLHLDKLDLRAAQHRKRFITALREKLPDLDLGDADSQLLGIGEQMMVEAQSSPAPVAYQSDDLLAAIPEDIRHEAEALMDDPELVQRVVEDVEALNVAGERELTMTVYLIGISRLLPHPLAGIVQGPSASGKSYLIEQTAKLFPAEAVIHATQMTPQALFHMKPGALSHRFVIAGERSRVEDDERAEATRALREMLSSGKLTKLMPVKVEGNRIETVTIEQDGPIAYVESTTLAKVFDEDANRCLMLHTDERSEQTRRIVQRLAESYRGVGGTAESELVVMRHHALQRLLQPLTVVVPFADRLAELFPCERVEARRAFPHLIGMIQASALLHQRQRPTDSDGRLVAQADDYHLARYLLAKPLARLLRDGISDPTRRFYDLLAAKWPTDSFKTTDAKKLATSSRSAVYGWLADLHDAGALELVEEGRGRKPAIWKLTATPPAEGAGLALPTVAALFGAIATARARRERRRSGTSKFATIWIRSAGCRRSQVRRHPKNSAATWSSWWLTTRRPAVS